MAKPLFDTSTVHFANLAEQCPVVAGAVVSKPLLNSPSFKHMLFSMDVGQEISEHHAPFLAVVHVLEGRLRFTAGDETRTMERDDWVVMPPNATHSLQSEAPTRFLLTMVKESSP